MNALGRPAADTDDGLLDACICEEVAVPQSVASVLLRVLRIYEHHVVIGCDAPHICSFDFSQAFQLWSFAVRHKRSANCTVVRFDAYASERALIWIVRIPLNGVVVYSSRW